MGERLSDQGDCVTCCCPTLHPEAPGHRGSPGREVGWARAPPKARASSTLNTKPKYVEMNINSESACVSRLGSDMGVGWMDSLGSLCSQGQGDLSVHGYSRGTDDVDRSRAVSPDHRPPFFVLLGPSWPWENLQGGSSLWQGWRARQTWVES